MKVINDYCNHCNSQRLVVEIDDEEGKPIFNMCFACLNYALTLLKRAGAREPVNYWDANVGIVNADDRAMMKVNFIASAAGGMK